MVFTLPAPIADLAYQNKAVIYGLLFDIAAETLQTIAADPRQLGARIGATLVLHSWGSALTLHPHVHGIVPGGGLSADGCRWVACRPGFFLPVRVLSRLFRRRFLEALHQAYLHGRLKFFGELAALADAGHFAAWLVPRMYNEKCFGEVVMHDTAMLLSALGWNRYGAGVEIITPYFGSSGTGQMNALVPVAPAGGG